MKTIRYLLDENVDPLYRHELLAREPAMVVWRVGDIGTPPDATPDPDILVWCEKNNFILVTNNRHSMPPHLIDHLARGQHIPGIIELNDKMSVGQTIEELWLIWAVSDGKEYRDQLVYLPLR